jgi:hypothetical protein
MNKITVIFFILSSLIFSQKILIPMDLSQTDHLKAYGIAYWMVKQQSPVDWLLNFRGGAFMADYDDNFAAECRIRGVSFETISSADAASIVEMVSSDNVNKEVIKLEKTPKIAVYAPPGSQPWDDAVRLALDYAEVEHEVIYDEEVIGEKLKEYDWLHLHHEDFTGQYGKFWSSYRNAPWYIQQVALSEAFAAKLGFNKVSELKLAVAQKIREYVANGGFVFAMCSAPDSFDVALAAAGTDICEYMFDGDGMHPNPDTQLDYSQTLAFENFTLVKNPTTYEISSIDVGPTTISNPAIDFFTLFEFSAKWDPVPTMLTQSHQAVIPGFLGQTTAFKKSEIKKDVIILGEREGTEEVKYIYGNYGRGFFAFYGGHDPADYRHAIGDPPTELRLHKNSASYRLILNNVLFPAAKKKKQKT